MTFRASCVLLLTCLPALAAQAAEPATTPPTPEQIAFFEKKIRPVLIENCYSCHSKESGKSKGGLLLDTREGLLKGGETGPAVVPGNPAKSLLIKAVRYHDTDLRMPPKAKLPDTVVADLEQWIKTGAADSRSGAARVVVNQEIDIDKGRNFWSFQPPHKAAAPQVRDTSWPRCDTDRFLLAAIEKRGLKPVADADRATLLRRLSFDLTGLPPTPEEVEAFLNDSTSTAYEKVVDRLLASPRFGERWGRHWLDVARYAETSGKDVNINYPQAWRYRDYVIKSFNDDKPYDRFVREQLAGDLLPAGDDKQKAEQMIATGFLAIGPKSHNERLPLHFQLDLVDEQIDATTQAFLGLTVACARCHDHKFDPIPQKDYYALAGIFRSTETCYGTIRIIQNNQPSSLLTLASDSGQPSALSPLTSSEREKLTKQIDDLKTEREKLRKDGKSFGTIEAIINNTRTATLQSKLDSYSADGTPKLLAMGVRERYRAVDSPLYQRGEPEKPGAIVARGMPQVLVKQQPVIRSGSGRKELAEWIASSQNPLTARVFANRVWLHLFGHGLVATPDNFGAMGHAPSNPELLDYLAVTFMDDGWSTKKLIRRLVLSRAYQMSSVSDARNLEVDPDNVLFWHQPRNRLEAEAVRDAMLAIGGQLETKPPVGSPQARVGEGSAQRFGFGGPGGPGGPGGGDRASTRSIYLPIVRNQLPEALSLFDEADPSMVVGERSSTIVPAQGLYLLNNGFVIRQADAAAERLLAQEGSDKDRVRRAYLLFYGRAPSEKEETAAEAFLTKYAAASGQDKDKTPTARQRKATWSAFCQALFAGAEFLYRS